MEKSKTPSVSNPVKFSSVIFSVCFAVCFVVLIHVEIELRVHRQMLQVLNQEREDSIELRKVVSRREKKKDFVMKMLPSGLQGAGSPTGNSTFYIEYPFIFMFLTFLTSQLQLTINGVM